jgi:hypothetical protein
MSIIDFVIFIIMSISAVVGVYNGFVLSALHTASSFLAWLVAVFFYPLITKLVLRLFPFLMDIITMYAEGSIHIDDVEQRRAAIQSFSPEKLGEVVENAQLPSPFSNILVSDFSKPLEGVQTLGDYFDSTVALVIINILSFLVLFLVLKALFTVIVSINKTVYSLPVLKKYDGAAGAGLGLVRGFFILYLIFALVPILLALAPTDIIHEFLDSSKLAGFFHHSNIFTSFVRGR